MSSLSKIPQFDTAIDTILKDLKPHERKCGMCGTAFRVEDADIEFYRSFHVPAPKLCPPCRRMRRLAFMNYTTFFKRRCDVLGHSEEFISSSPPGTDYPVYDFDYWWSDNWDAAQITHKYDPRKPFFENFTALFKQSPIPALTRDPASVESDYTLYGLNLKNCYYVFGGMEAENVMYSTWPLYTKDSLDTLIALNSALGYELVFSANCFNCRFAYFSRDCLDSSFLYDCRNCSSCFGCVNLRNKKHCFFNEQLSEEEYKKRVEAINLGNRVVLVEYRKKFDEFIKQNPVRAAWVEHSVDATGNFLDHSKNCAACYWILQGEDCRYGDFALGIKDSMDFSITSRAQRLFETANVGTQSYEAKFSVLCRVSHHIEYSMLCYDCAYCFGCIGLRNKKFHIFNIPYAESEYWEKLDEIKTRMLEVGEYGEFFPLALSHYPYNVSLASLIFPLEKEIARARGTEWHNEPPNAETNLSKIAAAALPEDIRDVRDDILDKAVVSAGKGRPFRVVKPELEFYRNQHIALPFVHPLLRMQERFRRVNFFRTTEDRCAKCGAAIVSMHAKDEGFKAYCGACYNAVLY